MEDMKDWEAESDLHTLRRAEEIKANPGKMARVKKYAAKVEREMKDVLGKDGSDATVQGYRRIG